MHFTTCLNLTNCPTNSCLQDQTPRVLFVKRCVLFQTPPILFQTPPVLFVKRCVLSQTPPVLFQTPRVLFQQRCVLSQTLRVCLISHHAATILIGVT